MTVRPLFKNRGTTPEKKRKKTRHLRAVKTHVPTTTIQNPSEGQIPWKTIIVTTLVTSAVSTIAVTIVRGLMDRASTQTVLKNIRLQKERDEVAHHQAVSAGATSATVAPIYHLPPPPSVAQHQGMTNPMMGVMSVNFDPNPFSRSHVQRSMPLPSAPHVSSVNEEEPEWFKKFSHDFERRMNAVEAAALQRQAEDEQ